eukprot:2285494-Lingulodinium_polyedra.AAC.1
MVQGVPSPLGTQQNVPQSWQNAGLLSSCINRTVAGTSTTLAPSRLGWPATAWRKRDRKPARRTT